MPTAMTVMRASWAFPSGSDWILNNPYSDKPFLQNFLALSCSRRWATIPSAGRFVEVFINTQSGRVSYPRDYAGIYVLLEKIRWVTTGCRSHR
jgi:hypothetical protein